MLRLDRLLTLYLFHPLRKILRQKESTRISILMYHSISDRDEDVRHPYFQTNTKPEIFARQMQFLADNDYKVISLSEALSLISNPSSQATSHKLQATKAPRYAVLTFDDGYRDFLDSAWPILKKHSFTAMMFLPTGFISNESQCLNSRDCLTWDEIKALAGEGVSFGAHTVSHVQLYELYKTASKQPNLPSPHNQESTQSSLSFLRKQESIQTSAPKSFPRRRESIETMASIEYELRASKQAIEEKLGKTVDHYSYAYAFPEHDTDFVQYLEQSLSHAGYTCAVSTRIGTAKRGDDQYILKRIPVNSHDDEDLLRAKLEGGYDWLNRIQVMKKKIRFAA